MLKVDVAALHTEVDEDLNKYIENKIGKLDKYMSRHVRKSAHVDVKLKESHAKDKKRCTCEVIVHLPKERITIAETTLNMYAAVDIVAAKLKNRLKKYKELKISHRAGHKDSITRRFLGKILSR
jgi:putative sigma-54 modulation protein